MGSNTTKKKQEYSLQCAWTAKITLIKKISTAFRMNLKGTIITSHKFSIQIQLIMKIKKSKMQSKI